MKVKSWEKKRKKIYSTSSVIINKYSDNQGRLDGRSSSIPLEELACGTTSFMLSESNIIEASCLRL